MLKQIIFFFILALRITLLNAQPIIPRFENLGVNDGLSHSSVYNIHQDKKGYMWFGTPNGLCRYDGNHFQNYQYHDAKNNTTNNFVRGKILEDAAGNLWFTNENGIYKWDKNSESVYLKWGNNLLEKSTTEYRALLLDENQDLWMFNLAEGIMKYNILSAKIAKFSFPIKVNYNNLTNTFIQPDSERKIWMKIGDNNADLMIFDLRSNSYTVAKDYADVRAIFFDHQQKMLVYKNKLVLEKSNGMRFIIATNKNKTDNSYRSGIKDEYGRWWLTSASGLSCYDENKNALNIFIHENLKINSLPFDITTCAYIDRTNNLWVGTDGGGIARLDLKQPRFYLFPLSMGDYPVLKDYFTKCFYEDDQQRIWFGTHSSGLNIYNPQTGSLLNFQNNPRKNNSLPGNIVGAIFRDKYKNIWIGTNAGVAIFDENKKSFRKITIPNYSPDFPNQGTFINKIIQLKNGNLLCATTRGLLKIYRKPGNKFYAEFPEHLNRFSSIDVVQLPNGTIYSAQSTGIIQLKCNGERFDSITTFLPGLDIKSISIDRRDEKFMWVASRIGLIHYNLRSGKYNLFTEKSGLGDNHVYGELEDSLGNLWISTNKGLSFFDIKNNKFKNYSHLHGLQSNEFNTHAFYKGASGNFYFGGINGFNWFKADFKNPIKTKPQAAITTIENNNQILINDTNYILHQLLSVPYNQNDFNFTFAALDFTLPKANKIQYQLEGWDEYPVITENKTVRYSNLPPARYRLKLKVLNPEEVWSDEEKIDIEIRAPYWKTKPFLYITSFLLLLLVVYITYFFSRQKEKKKIQLLEKQLAINAERVRISADMHDEIGSGITHIALMSEIVQAQHNGELKKEMQIISSSAHKLVQTISEIIWALNPQNDTLENLLAYMREQSQQYFEPFEMAFSIHFPEEIPTIKLTNEVRRNLYLVTKELLNNALKHAEASAISLSFCINKDHFSFTVTDNGVGINEAKKRVNANGIKNLKQRMNAIGGDISWITKERGTEVIYSMPLPKHTTFFTFKTTA
ncbi:MAG: two-component regulator propeller domain-containing protein [Ginsengibacter sp.]